ncbi:TatD family hydrolase [Thalassotalea sp. PLHSN55]|uniref:TatD family hydrolase n=1 Tax=Thalassotalea sp. PLHSN55 TaxID=3435888 RepID=UPI003F84B058
MNFTDSHCHIDFEQLASDEQLLEQCYQQHIDKIIVPSVSPDNWQSVLNFCNANDVVEPTPKVKKAQCYAALGIHPWYLKDLTQQALEKLSDKVAQNSHKLVAIGEAGIDGVIVKEQDNLAQQITFFDYQLQLAKQYHLPIIVHHRRSHQNIMPMLKKAQLSKGGIIHAFSGSYQQGCQYIDLGFKLGIGGTITYPRAEKTLKAIKRLPLESLVLETDAPSMPLFGFQGQSNSPLRLINIFEQLCQIRPESKEEIAAIIEQNIEQLFFAGA